MADVNDKIQDLIISRQVDTGRHANKLVRDILALLNDAMDDATAKIHKKMDKGPRTKARIDDLLASIQKLHADTYAEVFDELKKPLLDFAQHEAAGQVEMLERTISGKSQPTTRVIELPDGTMRESKVYRYRGLDVIVPKDLDITKQFQTPADIIKHLDEIPAKHRALLKEIRLLDIYSPDTIHSVASFDIKDKFVEIYRNDGRRDIDKLVSNALRHETGHALEETLGADFLKAWKKAAKTDGGTISDYARKDIHEDVAETLMNHWSPDKYERRSVEAFFTERSKLLKEYGIDPGGLPEPPADLGESLAIRLNVLTPNIEQIKVVVGEAPMQGRLLAEWWASLETSMATKTAQQIRLGIVEGESVSEIVKRLAGSAKDYEPGIWSIVRRETEAVCRTAINHISNQAAQAVFSANADLIKGVRWTSTLDGRTTPICQSRDGVVFPLKDGPRPPAHVGCRSFIVPITKSFRELGIDLDEIPESKRASMSGEVPADTTYGEWLRKNPAQAKEALGATRAKLFLDGKLDVGDFVTDKGTVYTLEVLKQRQSAAFAAALP